MCGEDAAATASFLLDAGVRDLVCDVKQIPGRSEKGRLAAQDLRAFRKPFDDQGIKLSAVTVGWMQRDESGAPPQSDLNTVCHDIEVLGEGGVPVAQLFDMGEVPASADTDRYRQGLYDSYHRLVSACARAKVKLAIHASWLPRAALWNTATLLSLFEAVPDSHNGVCFCAGSYYQSGDDVLESVERLGRRIHLVHFRDADTIGGNCPEMLLGNGRVPFAALASRLREIGYDGVVQCEHFGKFRCRPEGAVTAAWGAGFMRGVFQAR
jgi:sugar phosphate isomerase/epimerase